MANTIDEECHFYKDCYDTMKDEWETTTTAVKKKETQFKLQQHGLEILKCYGEQILQDNTDLTQCDDPTKTCAGCSPALDIRYDDVHAFIPGTEELGTFRPCTLSWWNSNYGEYTGLDTPVDDCSSCADPALGDFVSPNAEP